MLEILVGGWRVLTLGKASDNMVPSRLGEVQVENFLGKRDNKRLGPDASSFAKATEDKSHRRRLSRYAATVVLMKHHERSA